MSYILDALKKSEQERGHGNIPGVQTVHSSGLNYRNEKNSYWPYILITAIILNIAVILYFIFDKEEIPTTRSTSADVTEIITATTSNIKQQDVVDSIEPDPVPPVSPLKEQTDTTPTIEKQDQTKTIEPVESANKNSITVDDNIIIDFYELPESIKLQLPAIIISAHVYSDNPLQRSIVINNNFMEEGEYVLDDLILHEITAGGAIFDYNGTRFRYSVISSWQ